MILKSVKFKILIVFLLSILFFSCSSELKTYTIKVDNTTIKSRTSETVEIWFNKLDSIVPFERNLEVLDASKN